ncbi:MAG: ATP synthase F1 subunit gamma [Verrucomicrobiota bacterium]|jgi:F-type H+-transporting ATPase subunit gamma|nr:ATP synthase F1 subunit gamma [Verrucomicrobiota bacterium]MDD8045605.1 ATP synthase F1 subunit gamma [Verrucomicrobiota bacterium]MDD8049813.1 ATP synthase F1 subunit gamma [Verrucomicrobiota bacterium]MDI9383109.1 ATP synthase F1 subunit gamma [Verrucomicrobiota bacterium]HCF95050.1 ATP synthase F1 subunit gamma [Verrucomicrobiota bacterium]
MAQNPRDIRNRIRGIRNIGQVTGAMDMVASSRLRRAQASAQAARPYAQRIHEILQEVAAACPALEQHPLLQRRPVHKACVVVFTSDKGLCGGYNSNVLNLAEKVAQGLTASETRFVVIGRKGIRHIRSLGLPIDQTFPAPGKEVDIQEISAIAKTLITGYVTHAYDEIHLVFSSFVSAMRTEPTHTLLLPLGTLSEAVEAGEDGGETPAPARKEIDFIFEPSVGKLADYLLPLYIEVLINRALLDSSASEHAARMVAMRNASENADELIKQLSKTYNRVRQASITTEILEVVSGAEAFHK